MELIDFKTELEDARNKDKNIHAIFNKIVEDNLDNLKQFLEEGYNVRIIEDEEHFLKTLHFLSRESENWNYDFSFSNIENKCAFDDKEAITKILTEFVIELIREK